MWNRRRDVPGSAIHLQPEHRFKNQREAALTLFDFIEGFYNPEAAHTSIGNISPISFEQRYTDQAALLEAAAASR